MSYIPTDRIRKAVRDLRRTLPIRFGDKVVMGLQSKGNKHYDMAVEDVLDIIDKLEKESVL